MNVAAASASGSLALRFAMLSLGLLLLALVGFWPDYLAKSWHGIDAYTHAHAALGGVWLCLLIAQPLLFRKRQMTLHRQLGRVAVPIASGFVVSGVLLAHLRFSRMPAEVFAKAAPFLSLPLSMTLLFAVAVLLALLWRGSPPVHARFMGASALALIDPALARAIYFLFPPLPADWMYQAISFTLVGGILLALLATLPPTARGRTAFGMFAAGSILMLGLLFIVPRTDAWLGFARWFRSLPLT